MSTVAMATGRQCQKHCTRERRRPGEHRAQIKMVFTTSVSSMVLPYWVNGRQVPRRRRSEVACLCARQTFGARWRRWMAFPSDGACSVQAFQRAFVWHKSGVNTILPSFHRTLQENKRKGVCREGVQPSTSSITATMVAGRDGHMSCVFTVDGSRWNHVAKLVGYLWDS